MSKVIFLSHFLQVKTLYGVLQAESEYFPRMEHGMICREWSLSATVSTRKVIAKHSQKSAKMRLFCHSFVATFLADHFLPTIPWKMPTFRGMV